MSSEFGMGSSVIKYNFPCGGIVYLRVTEETKLRYQTDSCYKAEIDAKAYQHFLEKEEQRRRTEEEETKLDEELKLKETNSQPNHTSESSEEDDAATNKQKFPIGAASRVRVENGVISVAPKPTASRKRSTFTGKKVSKGPTLSVKKRRVGPLVSDRDEEPKPSSSTIENNSDEIDDMGIEKCLEKESDQDVALEDSGSDEGGGDPGKWTTKEVSLLLDIYHKYKSQFDEPYAVKFRIWNKICKIPEIAATGKSSVQLSKKIDNLKKTWRKMNRPGAKASQQWKWTEQMDLIFGDDPTIELNHVAEVGDRGPKKTATRSTNSSNWKTQLINIEKERVDVLKDIARSQVKKSETFDRLTSLIEKWSQK